MYPNLSPRFESRTLHQVSSNQSQVNAVSIPSCGKDAVGVVDLAVVVEVQLAVHDSLRNVGDIEIMAVGVELEP
jgi:hypothetical protein